MPSPENSADGGAIAQHRDALAGWAAFRALRQRSVPSPPRPHGNHRHGRYAKSNMEDRRRLQLWLRSLGGGKLDDPVIGTPPPPEPSGWQPGWRRYRERRR